MNVEPSMTSEPARAKVASALRQAGFDVRGGAQRMAFPFALRVAAVPEDREPEVWSIVRGIDPEAIEVTPATSWTHD